MDKEKTTNETEIEESIKDAIDVPEESNKENGENEKNEKNGKKTLDDKIIEHYKKANPQSDNVKIIVEHHEEQKSFSQRLLSVFIIILICATCFFGGMLVERQNTNLVSSIKIKKINDLIDKNYYFKDKINHNKSFENALSTYVASYGDQFTYYLGEETLESFNESITGGYVGIGVSVTTDDNGYITVTECYKGGSAYESGVLPGYKILKVDGENAVGVYIDDVVAMIKGQEGGTVVVTFLTPEGDKKDIELERKKVTITTVSSEVLDNNIAYLKISSFDMMTGEEVKEHMKTLLEYKPKGLIIDLRNNGGGLLDSVVETADYFMPESTIVTIKSRNAKDEVYKSDEKSVDIPIVILINQNTASASELLAGGLKCNNNATLIGEKSFGKGVVGTQFYIDSKSAMVITTGEYFLPDGTNIHEKGIVPDIEVALSDSIKNIYLMEKKDDTQLKAAIEEIEKK